LRCLNNAYESTPTTFSSVIISIQTVITFFSYVSFQNLLKQLGPDFFNLRQGNRIKNDLNN